MAINPNILLASRVPDVGASLGNALLTGQQLRLNQDVAPLTNQLLEQKVESGQGVLDSQRRQFLMQGAKFARDHAQELLKIPSFQQRRLANTAFNDRMRELGFPVSDELDDVSDAALNQVIAQLNPIADAGQQDQGLTEFQRRNLDLQERRLDIQESITPAQAERNRLARERLEKTTSPELQAEISGAKELAKLEAQKKVKPGLAALVEEAELNARATIEEGQGSKKNQAAFNVYNTAMEGLLAGLQGTETGPFAGRLPALTANQQIADGAIAAMAPILKSIFRTAGEGTFTDKDQELLLAMVPTRKDRQAARLAKLQNIDAIVRAKLSPGSDAPESGQRLIFDPKTGGLVSQ